MSPARGAACQALRAMASGERFEVALRRTTRVARLDPRDAALTWELAAGVTKRRRTLDAVLARFTVHPLRSLTPDVRCALRLGAYQLLFLDRVPPHSAVDESVRLVHRRSKRAAGFVNAVLRRVAMHGREALADLASVEGAEGAAVRLSYPTWLVRSLQKEWGPSAAVALLEQGNLPAERCVRVQEASAVEEAVRLLQRDGMTVRHPQWATAGLCPEALVVEGGSLEGSEAYQQGAVWPQSRASQLVGRVAAAGMPPGVSIADLCAAPGGKAAHLQALLAPRHLLVVDVQRERVNDLRSTLRRLQVRGADVRLADARRLPADLDGRFDLALVDAPCSGLGTLASKPDLRWRRRPSDSARLASLQRGLLLRAAKLVRPGGRVVYAVCTVTRVETVDVVAATLGRTPLALDDLGSAYPALRDARLGAALLTWPPRDGTSGFFIARFRRV